MGEPLHAPLRISPPPSPPSPMRRRAHYLVLNPLAGERIELHAPPNTKHIMGTTGRGPHRFLPDRISILYYTKSWHTLSLVLSASFLPSSSSSLHFAPLKSERRWSPRRRESSGEKGWRRGCGALRKGGADFRPRACLCEHPLTGHPISVLPNGRH